MVSSSLTTSSSRVLKFSWLISMVMQVSVWVVPLLLVHWLVCVSEQLSLHVSLRELLQASLLLLVKLAESEGLKKVEKESVVFWDTVVEQELPLDLVSV